MTEVIGSWLAQAVVLHDQAHGADLSVPWTGHRLCQVIQFDTYRDESDPHRRIEGVIADTTHHVCAAFDVAATDAFENPGLGLPSESLTSHLRSIFTLKRFRFHLEPPHSGGKSQLCRVRLEVLDWEVHSGGKDDPVWRDGTAEVGRGKDDAEVQRVLQKWWSGDGSSGQAQVDSSPDAGPSRPHSTTQPTYPDSDGSHSLPRSQQPLRPEILDFLLPFLHQEGKRPKAMPDWMFEVPADARRELDAITVFGLDLHSASTTDNAKDGSANEAGGPDDMDWEYEVPRETQRQFDRIETFGAGAQKPSGSPNEPSTGSGQKSSLEAPPPGQRTPALPPAPAAASSSPHRGAPSSEESESENDIPIKPLARRPGKRKMFDPLAVPSSPDLHQDGDATDEEALSDYERQVRRTAKSRAIEADGERGEEEDEDVQISVEVVRNSGHSDSLSASQRSGEFTLSMYAEQQASQDEGVGAPVLVGESGEPGWVGAKRQTDSEEEIGEADASLQAGDDDDEDVVHEPSVRQGAEVNHRQGEELTGERVSADPAVPLISSDKEEPRPVPPDKPAEASARRYALFRRPLPGVATHTSDRSSRRQTSSTSPDKHVEDRHDGNAERYPKLGGFKPNLVPEIGLTASWVQERRIKMVDLRAKDAQKGRGTTA